jgi:Mg2+-importing ATPase
MTKKTLNEMLRRDEVFRRMHFAATVETEELFEKLGTGPDGVYDAFVVDYRDAYGDNKVSHGKKVSPFKRLAKAFIDPFNSFLLVLVVILFFTNIIFAEPGDADPMAVIIISTIVLISGLLHFVQETRSGYAAENLHNMMTNPVNVQRQKAGKKEIPFGEVVVGDIVHVYAGEMIPADMRIIESKDLFVSQSALTGESAAVEKIAVTAQKKHNHLTDTPNLVFMGSNVVSGNAAGVVVAVGDDTVFGEMAKNASEKPVKTSFDKGANSLSFWRWRWSLHQNCFQ